jgi:hypothetical protein
MSDIWCYYSVIELIVFEFIARMRIIFSALAIFMSLKICLLHVCNHSYNCNVFAFIFYYAQNKFRINIIILLL